MVSTALVILILVVTITAADGWGTVALLAGVAFCVICLIAVLEWADECAKGAMWRWEQRRRRHDR